MLEIDGGTASYSRRTRAPIRCPDSLCGRLAALAGQVRSRGVVDREAEPVDHVHYPVDRVHHPDRKRLQNQTVACSSAEVA